MYMYSFIVNRSSIQTASNFEISNDVLENILVIFLK